MADAARAASDDIRQRVARAEGARLAADLDEWGFARLPGLLRPAECAALAALFERDACFRSTVEMERHRFGVGRYRYFANPVPAAVRALRTHLYAALAPIATRWEEALGTRVRYPPRWSAFRARCAAAGQRRPTPLLLRYTAGGYNCLHQDRYGEVAFPLQVTIQLSRPGVDFGGGEFLLVEQRPRMQSRGSALALAQGEAVIFPNAERPARGARGFFRTQVRHGVSRVAWGTRVALGIIFHEAR